MKRYPVYKDSGVEWLGEVPERWKTKKLKWIVIGNLKYGANESAELEDRNLPRYIRITDFGPDGNLRDETFKSLPDEIAEEYLLAEGDVLFARSGATVGKTFQFKNYSGKACFAGYLIKATPNEEEISSDFLYYFTKSNSYENWKNSIFIQATIQNIGADKYQTLEIPIPSLSEQKKITQILDHKTNLIDTFIDKKKKQIELLNEQKTAIINHAVTKGLDPNVKKKDSGVEWLGEIPEHWTTINLNYVGMKGLSNGIFKKSDQFGRGTKIVNVIDIYQDDFLVRVEQLNRVEVNEKESATYEVLDGDIFFVRSSLKLEGTGVSACIPLRTEPMVFECHIVRFRPNTQKVLPKFLINYLNSSLIRHRFIALAKTVTMSTISQSEISSIKVILPSIEEQQSIVILIEKEYSRVKNSIHKIQNQIKLLQEYRTTLISEAVTGKIDVRDEKVPLS
jgi:type I restriction enzyme, S subunit